MRGNLFQRCMQIAVAAAILAAGCSDSTGVEQRPGEVSVVLTDVSGGVPFLFAVTGDISHMPNLLTPPSEGARAFRSRYAHIPSGVVDSAVFVMGGVRPSTAAPGSNNLMDVFTLDIPMRFVSVGEHEFTCQQDASCIRTVLALGQRVDSLGKTPVVYAYPQYFTEAQLRLDEVTNDRIKGTVRQAVFIQGTGTPSSTGILTATFDVPIEKRSAECIAMTRC